MGLREQKKKQTRAGLMDAAARLFAENGYDGTTVADIAAAAGVSTRTFFSYFPAKEDVLFAGTDQRLAVLAEALATVRAESPPEAVGRILEHVLSASDDPASPGQLAIMLARPDLQVQGLQRLIVAHRLIADWLRQAYPGWLDERLSRAAAGALLGALVCTVLTGTERGDSPRRLRAQLRRALTLLENGLRAP
jgi:AcrR family transcriptional regulator